MSIIADPPREGIAEKRITAHGLSDAEWSAWLVFMSRAADQIPEELHRVLFERAETVIGTPARCGDPRRLTWHEEEFGS